MYSDFCVDALELFVAEVAPKLGIHIYTEEMVISNEHVIIPFALNAALDLARDNGRSRFQFGEHEIFFCICCSSACFGSACCFCWFTFTIMGQT